MTDGPALRIAPDFLHEPALVAVMDALPRARVVGGAVRDALAGRVVADIDLATPDTPREITALLKKAGLRAVPTGVEHGTVTAVSDHRGFEITTLRHDVATDGRRATVAFTDDWREDASRRDFTINALSMTRDGDVFDYFGGVADLRAGVVRFIGDASARIAEDYLRMLRFFRFQARFGADTPDATAVAAIRANLAGLSVLSSERIWSELKGILATHDPSGVIALMAELGMLQAVLPEGTAPARLAALIAAGAPADPLLRLAALLDGDARALAARLRLSGAEADRLAALRSAVAPPEQADDAALRRNLADTPKDIVIDAMWLGGRDAALRARVAAMDVPVFPLQGRDLRRAGVSAGPALGDMLRGVRAWWMAGGCVADAEACRAELVRRLGDR